MEDLALQIVKLWQKLVKNCKDHNPQFYRGAPHLTDHWCNNKRNRQMRGVLSLGQCSMSYCPLLYDAKNKPRRKEVCSKPKSQRKKS